MAMRESRMYSPHKGTASKKMQLQLKDAGLDDLFTFFKCISEYARTALISYGLLRKSEAHYQNSLYIIRLLTDAIITTYGVSLANNPVTYIDNFLANKPTNRLKSGKENLTASYIVKKANEEYEGIEKMYQESNNYLHPSIYYRAKRANNIVLGVLTTKSSWKDNLSKTDSLNCRLDYIITSLRKILYDVQIEVFNKAVVPLYPELSTIQHNRELNYLHITYSGFSSFINQWREDNNFGWRRVRTGKNE